MDVWIGRYRRARRHEDVPPFLAMYSEWDDDDDWDDEDDWDDDDWEEDEDEDWDDDDDDDSDSRPIPPMAEHRVRAGVT